MAKVQRAAEAAKMAASAAVEWEALALDKTTPQTVKMQQQQQQHK